MVSGCPSKPVLTFELVRDSAVSLRRFTQRPTPLFQHGVPKAHRATASAAALARAGTLNEGPLTRLRALRRSPRGDVRRVPPSRGRSRGVRRRSRPPDTIRRAGGLHRRPPSRNRCWTRFCCCTYSLRSFISCDRYTPGNDILRAVNGAVTSVGVPVMPIPGRNITATVGATQVYSPQSRTT